jgi:hypothetical protein
LPKLQIGNEPHYSRSYSRASHQNIDRRGKTYATTSPKEPQHEKHYRDNHRNSPIPPKTNEDRRTKMNNDLAISDRAKERVMPTKQETEQ